MIYLNKFYLKNKKNNLRFFNKSFINFFLKKKKTSRNLFLKKKYNYYLIN